jgi:hypothetical protein
VAGFCEHGDEPSGSVTEAGYFLIRVGLSAASFPPALPPIIFYTFPLLLMRATCPSHSP